MKNKPPKQSRFRPELLQMEERNLYNATPVDLSADMRTPVLSEPLKQSYGLDKPYYQKYADVSGMPIATSGVVSTESMAEAKYLLEQMLPNRPDIFRQLQKDSVKLVISGQHENITDIPEYDFLTPKDYWNVRARGFGPTREVPMISVGEESLLNLTSDRWRGESVLIHEMAHAVELAINEIDPTYPAKLKALFQNAKDKGLWEGTYARENPQEYWAESVQCYFGAAKESIPTDGVHNEINTREELKAYDPLMFKLVDEVFQKNPWTYVPYATRQSINAVEAAKKNHIQEPSELHGVMVDIAAPVVKPEVKKEMKPEVKPEIRSTVKPDEKDMIPHGIYVDKKGLEAADNLPASPPKPAESTTYWRKLFKPSETPLPAKTAMRQPTDELKTQEVKIRKDSIESLDKLEPESYRRTAENDSKEIKR